MTREEALKMLSNAPRINKPSKLNPALTCEQCTIIVENSVASEKPGTVLDALTVKRVYQVSLNQKKPKILQNNK